MSDVGPAIRRIDRGPGQVVLSDLEKRFDDVLAVRGIDLDIAGGEFFSLLGPSGCGKTTTLRMIGGFERPDRGKIWIAGDELSGPLKRAGRQLVVRIKKEQVPATQIASLLFIRLPSMFSLG